MQVSYSISHYLGPPPQSNPIPSCCNRGPLTFLDKHQDSFSFVPFRLGHSVVEQMNIYSLFVSLLCLATSLSPFISLSVSVFLLLSAPSCSGTLSCGPSWVPLFFWAPSLCLASFGDRKKPGRQKGSEWLGARAQRAGHRVNCLLIVGGVNALIPSRELMKIEAMGVGKRSFCNPPGLGYKQSRW